MYQFLLLYTLYKKQDPGKIHNIHTTPYMY